MSGGGAEPGRTYTKIKDIGQGSYGKAILVQDRDSKLYVMKVIDMSRMDGKQRKDAINEVKVLSSLKHPYIVSYRESYTENRNLNIVMDYADGGDLHQRITRTRHAGKTFPEEKMLRWFTEATLALKYLHDRHVLHRDLKSQNLFLTSQDRLRIGDFGISKVLESTAAFARTTIGTPYYLSPEICMEKPYSFSSDIWALGCILYELAALRVPFDAQNLQALVQKITRGPTPQLPANCSAELRQLCGDLLHRDQSSRPNACEILQRQIIQSEIRRMLREEQNKGVSVASKPSSEVGSDLGSVPRKPPPAAVAQSQAESARPPLGQAEAPRPLMMQKLPRDNSEEGGLQPDGSCNDGRLSARHHQHNGPPLLKGVGVSVMDNIPRAGGGGGGVRDPSPSRALIQGPSREWDQRGPQVPAGVPSRQHTPAGLWRGSKAY
jgi:NIMA (never in mitosis gene a)-related kinase